MISTVIQSVTNSALRVMEVSLSDSLISSHIHSVIDNTVYFDDFDVEYTVVHPEPDLISQSTLFVKGSSLAALNTNPLNVSLFKKKKELLQAQNIVILNLIENSFASGIDLNSLVTYLSSSLLGDTCHSFLLVLFKDRDFFSERQNSITKNCLDSQSLTRMAFDAGLIPVMERNLWKGVHPLSCLLLKKKEVSVDENVILSIELMNEQEWLPKLVEIMRNKKPLLSTGKSKLWLTCLPDNKTVNGVYGLCKSLRLEEGGEGVRVIVSDDHVNFDDNKYSKILEMDNPFNVFDSKSGSWGFHSHLDVPEKTVDDRKMIVSKFDSSKSNMYLRMNKPGDLTSFYWSLAHPIDSNLRTTIKVHYAALNFKDVMYATGGLPPDISVPGLSPGDLPLGLEFSGTDVNGNRVMGMVPCKALSTMISVPDPDFVWNVPRDWSLEEASSVPVVYSTAYYALIIRGKLISGESILIHSASGGVGLAATRIALNRGCQVFCTVGSEEKKDFLIQEFAEYYLTRDRILSSRSTEFEADILRLTDGRGVDVVLNSLSGDKLQASLNCLTDSGRFLEIGKVDFLANSILKINSSMGNNKSFHGIILDSLMQFLSNQANSCSSHHLLSKKVSEERLVLRSLITSGILSREVKPLSRRTVFPAGEEETAFRFLTTGKHIGKVIIRVASSCQEEDLLSFESEESSVFQNSTHSSPVTVKLSSSTPSCIPFVYKKTIFSSNKSYIVVGGLGGFALEVVYWMICQGAKDITLVSRSGVKTSYQKYCLRRFESLGGHIKLSNINCISEDATRQLLKEASLDKPVGGIFSLATTYRDCLVTDQTVESFTAVSDSKAKVTFFLDKLSREEYPVDYFVCFSSASCGRGNAGQTSYNYANGVMEEICRSRVKDGLHGLSIQWGVVGDVGVVAENAVNNKEIILLGSRSQRMPSCFSTLDRLMQRKDIAVCLNLVKKKRRRDANGLARDTYSSADLIKSICHIIGIKDISSVDRTATLGSIGIDSLIAIEIKQTLERTHSLVLSLKEIRNLTIQQLLDFPTAPSEVSCK